MDWPLVPLKHGVKRRLEQELRDCKRSTPLKRPSALRRPAAEAAEEESRLQQMRLEGEERAHQDAGLCGSFLGCRDENEEDVEEKEHEHDSGPEAEENETKTEPKCAPGSSSSSSSTSSTSTSSEAAEPTGETASAPASSASLSSLSESDVGHAVTQEAATGLLLTEVDDSTDFLAVPVSRPASDVATPDDMFKTASRACQKVKQLYGEESIKQLKANLRTSKLISLYSGLGGAELAFEQAHIASNCLPGIGDEDEGHEGRPSNIFACECDPECLKVLHSHKARGFERVDIL